MATGLVTPWVALALGWLWLVQRSARFRRTRALTVLLAASSLGLLVTRGTGREAQTLSLEAVDIGQGDALLVRAPGAEALLVDTGPNPWAARRLARVLSRRGVREPVRLVLTHPHGDHAGGWATLHRLWPLASVAGPAVVDTDEDWGPWQPPGALPPRPLRRGDLWRSAGLEASVRWPPLPFRLPDANMVSAVLRLRWQDRELWLMGDALEVQERDLLDLGDPGPGPFHRLLKVGHHGSRSSSTGAWVAALAPEAALIPAGRRNRFGHPHPETLDTLRLAGLPEPWIVGPALGVRVEAAPGGWRWQDGRGAAGFTPFRRPLPPSAVR
jgi:competence protein ComEC